MSTLYERCQKVMSGVSNRATKLGVIDSDGAYLYTEDGREILDFASGVAVNNIGAKNSEVVEAVKKEMDHMIHVRYILAILEQRPMKVLLSWQSIIQKDLELLLLRIHFMEGQ